MERENTQASCPLKPGGVREKHHVGRGLLPRGVEREGVDRGAARQGHEEPVGAPEEDAAPPAQRVEVPGREEEERDGVDVS